MSSDPLAISCVVIHTLVLRRNVHLVVHVGGRILGERRDDVTLRRQIVLGIDEGIDIKVNLTYYVPLENKIVIAMKTRALSSSL